MLLRGIYLSLDPCALDRISGQRSYAKPTEIGEVIEGRVVGAARSPGRVTQISARATIASGGYGWQTP